MKYLIIRFALYLSTLAILAGCFGGDSETSFYPNGQVKREVETRNGRAHGTTRDYSINGTLLTERQFNNGRLIETDHCNRSDGDC